MVLTIEIIVMVLVVVAVVAFLAKAIVHDRRSERASVSADASIHENLVMPQDLKEEPTHTLEGPAPPK